MKLHPTTAKFLRSFQGGGWHYGSQLATLVSNRVMNSCIRRGFVNVKTKLSITQRAAETNRVETYLIAVKLTPLGKKTLSTGKY